MYFTNTPAMPISSLTPTYQKKLYSRVPSYKMLHPKLQNLKFLIIVSNVTFYSYEPKLTKKTTFYTYIKKEIGLQQNETTPCQLQVTSMKTEVGLPIKVAE